MNYRYYIVILLLSTTRSFGQVVSNNGAEINIGSGGVVNVGNLINTTGTLSNAGSIILSGDCANTGTITGTGNYTLSGNWSNNGSFTASAGSTVTFNGTTQTIGGTIPTTFNKLTINPGSTTTLDTNITVSSHFIINGTFNPKASPTHTVTGGDTSTIGASGTLKVYAASFAGNYPSPGYFDALNGSTVEYAGTTQTIAPAIYSNVVLSNSGTKTLSGNASLKNLTVQSGNTLTNNGNLRVSGTISNSGSINSSNGGVELNGTLAQAIPAGLFASNSIKDLTTNNSAGVTLGGTLSVTGILKASTGTFATGSYLTLASSAAQTALIDGSGAGSVTGTVTMQRYLPSGFGYRYLSSPFQAATVAELANDVNLASSFPSVYRYDENLVTAGWVNYTTTTGVLNPLEGYAVNCGSSSSAKTVDISGIVNNGTINAATLYNHNRTYTLGFNLAGNPYPSPIDWNAVAGWTKTNIDNALYYFNPSSTDQYTGAYTTYINGISSDGIASNIIPSMQAFFVHVTNGSYPVSASLSVNNAARVNNLSPVFHKELSAEDRPLIRLSAAFEGDTNKDYTAVYFEPGTSAAFETGRDARKLNNTDDHIPSLYAVSSDEVRLSISGIPDPGESITAVPLGLITGRDGMMHFNAPVLDRIPSGLHVYFADAATGIITDMLIKPEYSIQLEKGSYDHRFYLLFSKSDKVTIPGVEEELQAYSSGRSIFVYLSDDHGDLRISNVSGQLVNKETITGKGYHEVKISGATGLYVATLDEGGARKSKKVIVSE